MGLPLIYDYESSMLRVSSIEMTPGINVAITITSNEKDTIHVGFTREDSAQNPLGYKNAIKITRATIQALQDVLTTKNEMINKLSSSDVVIEMYIQALPHCKDRRLRLYKTLIDKNIAHFEKIKSNPFKHNKTTITNNAIMIFIQRR